MKLCPRTAPAPMAQRGGTGFPKACVHALGVPGSVPQVQVLSLRPAKAEWTVFGFIFCIFGAKSCVFPPPSHHPKFRNFFDHSWSWCDSFGCFCSGGSAHIKSNNSKGSRRYSLREPFSLFTAYQKSIFSSVPYLIFTIKILLCATQCPFLNTKHCTACEPVYNVLSWCFISFVPSSENSPRNAFADLAW